MINRELYSRVKCNKLYIEAGLEKEEVNLLIKYFNAASNLYGAIQLKDVYDIYCIENKIDKELFYKFVEILIHQEECFHISCLSEQFSNIKKQCIENWYLIDSFYIFNDNVLNILLEEQSGKDYCILETKLFLRYNDAMYYEKTKEYKELYKCIENDYNINTKHFCAMLMYGIREGDSFKVLMRCTDELNFDSMEEANKVIALITNLYNNSRMHSTKGHTPKELSRETTHLSAFTQTNNVSKEVSRNDPCICGSGKKYKKCCMLN